MIVSVRVFLGYMITKLVENEFQSKKFDSEIFFRVIYLQNFS